MRSVFFLWPVLEESEYSWPLAEMMVREPVVAEMMVREPVVAEMKDHQSRNHHHCLSLAAKEDPPKLGMFCPPFSSRTHHRSVSTYCLASSFLYAIASTLHWFCS
jgi:hypothetical protein